MLPVAQFFSRINRDHDEPRPDVLDEEYKWVFGRKPGAGDDHPGD